MRARSGSVGAGIAPGITGKRVVAMDVTHESVAKLDGIDYASEYTFAEIRDDVLDVIKGMGDRYDIRTQTRSLSHAAFELSPDSLSKYNQLVKAFEDRPEFNVQIGPSVSEFDVQIGPSVSGRSAAPVETVTIYREARPAPTYMQLLRKHSGTLALITVASAHVCYFMVFSST